MRRGCVARGIEQRHREPRGGADDEAESIFSDDRDSEAGEVEGPDAEDDCPTVGDIVPSRVLRELDSFDDVDISGVMRSRAVVMKNPPHFLRGAFRSVLRFAFQEANAATAAQNERRQRSAWKLFLMAPRMLLFRKARGLIPENQLQERFARFARGQWGALLLDSQEAVDEASSSNGNRFCRQEGRTSTGLGGNG